MIDKGLNPDLSPGLILFHFSAVCLKDPCNLLSIFSGDVGKLGVDPGFVFPSQTFELFSSLGGQYNSERSTIIRDGLAIQKIIRN